MVEDMSLAAHPVYVITLTCLALDYAGSNGPVDCTLKGLAVNGACQQMINEPEIRVGGRLLVTCTARQLGLEDSGVSHIKLYKQGVLDEQPTLMATYSMGSSENNFTIPGYQGKIVRSQKWDKRAEFYSVLTHTVQLVKSNFARGDAGQYICELKRENNVPCSCSGTARLKGNMSMVNAELVEQGDSFTVTCSVNASNSLPLSPDTRHYHVISLNRYLAVDSALDPVLNTSWTSTKHDNIGLQVWTMEQGSIDATGGPRSDAFVALTVLNARCSESNVFECRLIYKPKMLSISTFTTVVVKEQIVSFSLSVSPVDHPTTFYVNDHIKMVCTAEGAKDIILDWRLGYPYKNRATIWHGYPDFRDIEMSTSQIVRPGLEACLLYQHTSVLRFKALDKHDGYIFACALLSDGDDSGQKEHQLFLKTKGDTAATQQSVMGVS